MTSSCSLVMISSSSTPESAGTSTSFNTKFNGAAAGAGLGVGLADSTGLIVTTGGASTFVDVSTTTGAVTGIVIAFFLISLCFLLSSLAFFSSLLISNKVFP